VIAHRLWQVSFVSDLIDGLTYRVRSSTHVVEFLRRPVCAEVPGREPDSVSHFESDLLRTCVIRLFLLGLEQVLSEDPVSFLFSFEQDVCLGLRLVAGCFPLLKLQLGIPMIHCLIRGHPCRRVHGVVVREFRQR